MNDKVRAEFEEVFPKPASSEWRQESNYYCWGTRGPVHPYNELWQVWLAAKEKYEPKISGYGCHCDLEPNQSPDGCVIDEGRINDCVYAKILSKEGKVRDDCEYWQPIRAVTSPRTQGGEL